MGGVTPGAERVLKVIKEFIDEHGYSPTVRDICAIMGFSSPATVQRYFESLEDEGKIVREPKLARSLRVVDDESTAAK